MSCHRITAAGPILCGLLLALSAVAPSAGAEPLPWGDRAEPPWEGYQGVVRNDDDGLPGSGGGAGTGIPQGHCHREAIGAIAGGALGGLIGSRVGDGDGATVAVIAGTLIGMFVGSRIGRHMDELDERCIGQVLERAPDGQVVTWRNPDTGAVLSAEPQRTFRQDGRYCRDYLASLQAAGDTRRLDGTACRDADGTWQRL